MDSCKKYSRKSEARISHHHPSSLLRARVRERQRKTCDGKHANNAHALWAQACPSSTCRRRRIPCKHPRKTNESKKKNRTTKIFSDARWRTSPGSIEHSWPSSSCLFSNYSVSFPRVLWRYRCCCRSTRIRAKITKKEARLFRIGSKRKLNFGALYTSCLTFKFQRVG